MNAYVRAREAIGTDALVKVTANFRSVEPILDLVNTKFKTALSEAAGQPGFTPLTSTRKSENGSLAVAALEIRVDADEPNAAMLRDAEANRVADLCSRLVGNREVRTELPVRRVHANLGTSHCWRLSAQTYGVSRRRSKSAASPCQPRPAKASSGAKRPRISSP